VGADELAGAGVALVRAANPGPFTLSGTNTWIVRRDPAWIVDPGPHLAGHVDAIVAELERRGGLGGIALTHRHADHDAAVPALRARLPAPVAAASGEADVRPGDGDAFGPLVALPTPGHAPDHLAWVLDGRVGFTGDAVLGEGSVFVTPGRGSLSGYLAALERLRSLRLALLCPGHGPPVTDPAGRLAGYLAHRREREERLLGALARGGRSADDLLDAVWDDVPAALRPAAAITLAAHLDKLEEEGRLPDGVERPTARPAWLR
jgi:glyoxylase-like metal-dependent hydrolase (beta-lactamase superfamily II)